MPQHVMSIRFSPEEFKKIRLAAEREEKEKSRMARELMLDGLKFKMLLAYREGNASLTTLGQTLGMCLSETIDFLALFGIPAPISYDDHLQALETARRCL
ncbi:MAG: hypothetical protein A3G34_16530 [Candidatus Lindowbacteria bacterium RIFCSPLOWO2_12_FULL_62_27]|nr:MAG: hypothetical protein A3G34_16530 [Candidatus Lindowbacteria bacterium RIFCSPLOWO2_12_FULL_62_27]